MDGERRYRCVLELTKEGHLDKEGKPLRLPANVVERTLEKYLEAFRRLTGRNLQL